MYAPINKKVYSWDKMIAVLFSKIEKNSETKCWLWTGSCSLSGYGRIKYNGKTLRAHRISWIHHNGKIPDCLNVLHKCDTRNCVNPEHLFLGKPVDNTCDMMRKGRRINPTAKLNNEDIIIIRNDTRKQIEISREFGISRSQVSKIKNIKSWEDV